MDARKDIGVADLPAGVERELRDRSVIDLLDRTLSGRSVLSVLRHRFAAIDEAASVLMAASWQESSEDGFADAAACAERLAAAADQLYVAARGEMRNLEVSS